MPPLVLFQTQRFLSSVKTASPAASSSPMWRQSMQTKAIAPSRQAAAALPRVVVRNAVNALLAHLAGGQGELAVLDRAEPADMAVDRHVVGRVGEDQVDRLAVQQRGDSRRRRAHRRRAADAGRRCQTSPGRVTATAADGSAISSSAASAGVGRGLARLVEHQVDLGRARSRSASTSKSRSISACSSIARISLSQPALSASLLSART